MAVDVLQAKIRKLKNPTMVCICPTIRELPLHIKEDARHQYGQTLRAAAEAYKTFSFGILDALKDTVPAVSVISGAFSALGADGVAAMQEVLSYAASLGYYVLLDLMRADLGTTAEDLANACFGKIQVGEESFTPYACDGVLMSGFLGSDAVKPFAEFCREGKNVFIVARSSNKSAREVQDLLSGDRVVYQVMADLAMRWVPFLTVSFFIIDLLYCFLGRRTKAAMSLSTQNCPDVPTPNFPLETLYRPSAK